MNPSAEIAAVELIDIRRQFGATRVLDGINLLARPGQVIALYGRSGSGKTTLINLAGGLDQPDGGRVLVDGIDLAALSSDELSDLRRRRMGFIFQSYGLLAHLSALDNVIFGLRLAGVPRREWRDRALQALDAVGLKPRVRHWPAELSGGEQQRVAIARVLSVRPHLILADEPTGALDHATALSVTDLLVAFARETAAAILIATHDGTVAQRVDRAFEIKGGALTPRTEVKA